MNLKSQLLLIRNRSEYFLLNKVKTIPIFTLHFYVFLLKEDLLFFFVYILELQLDSNVSSYIVS